MAGLFFIFYFFAVMSDRLCTEKDQINSRPAMIINPPLLFAELRQHHLDKPHGEPLHTVKLDITNSSFSRDCDFIC